MIASAGLRTLGPRFSGRDLRLLYSLDFTAQSTQDMKAGGNGTYTIDGRGWSANVTQASTFRLLNGTGLQIIRTASASSNPPRLEIPLVTLVPNLRVFRAPVLIWFRVINNAPATSNTWTRCQVYNTGSGSRLIYFGRCNSAGTQQFRSFTAAVGSPLNTTNNLSDDVYCVVINGQYQAQVYSGVWASGWPLWRDMNGRGNPPWVSAMNLAAVGFNPGTGNESFSIGVSAHDPTDGAGLASMTVTHLQVEGISV